MVEFNKLFNLNDKLALVTGAGQNLGQAIARGLASQGCHVIIADIDPKKAKHTQESILAKGFEATTMVLDVTQPDQIDDCLQSIKNTFGRLDIAYNNVGLCYGDGAENLTLDDWDAMLNTNLRSTFYSCQQQFKIMRPVGYGKIINTASIAGVLVPHPQKITAYNTAKAGVIHLTRSLAAEWAEVGISVNCISPGVILTPQLKNAGVDDWINQWQQQIPMHRLADTNDIVGAAIYLASPASDYMTGQNIIIDGGHSLW